MKSREYRNTINGMTYWLEDGRVLVRKPGKDLVVESSFSASDFFKMVGLDILVLIEE
jgi:hypothetical protein|nr:MAG TPA: hypothetical protein [Caudoviricetes sp.]